MDVISILVKEQLVIKLPLPELVIGGDNWIALRARKSGFTTGMDELPVLPPHLAQLGITMATSNQNETIATYIVWRFLTDQY